MIKMIKVLCLDTGGEYFFIARTPYEAMQKMKYYLDTVSEDKDCIINKNDTQFSLYMTHKGLTYATLMQPINETKRFRRAIGKNFDGWFYI